MVLSGRKRVVFFFNDTATTEIYTLSLHDALPILRGALHASAIPIESGTAMRKTTSDAGRSPARSSFSRFKGLTSAREASRSEEHTSELQSRQYLVCRLLLETKIPHYTTHLSYITY